ncbi:3-methyladenine DNA glycosylase [Actinomycetes bacterium M1A6_2h]
MNVTDVQFAVLDETEWTERRTEHRERVDALVGAYAQARRHGRSHPVLDFLFTYYNLKPGLLRRWSPGFGTVLTGAATEDFVGTTGFAKDPSVEPSAVRVSDEFLLRRRSTLEFVEQLTRVTAAREPVLKCFGLHEWAMVYRGDPASIRHDVPLRLGSSGTDKVVEAAQLKCTHYDAFRFFTPEAAPMNLRSLTREDQLRLEQPGCLHANMDLYKWCTKLGPLVPSDLVLRCFDLALRARELDMRASPYDLTDLGYVPVEIETAAGRAEYVRAQAEVSAEAAPLRRNLSLLCRRLLSYQ